MSKSLMLEEEEIATINAQFGSFLRGRATSDNVVMVATNIVMHTDSHNDTHTDQGPSS